MKLHEQKMDPSKFVGKTANLYLDKSNENFVGQLKINNVRPARETLKNNEFGTTYAWDIIGEFTEFGKKKPEQISLFFLCGKPPSTLIKAGGPGLYIDRVGGKVIQRQFYSANLENELSKFCVVSKGGAIVPKADFVSADVTVNEPMAEGKKIVRLTEADLVRLVKKVVSERFEIMGELLSRAEEFLKENGIDSSNMDENEIYENVDMLTQDENKRIRHFANKLKAEMIGFFGRQS